MCGICWGKGVCGVRGQWGVFSQSTVYMYTIVNEYIFKKLIKNHKLHKCKFFLIK